MNKNSIKLFLNETYSTFEIKRRLLLLKNFLFKKFFNSEFKKEDFEAKDLQWLDSLGAEFLDQFTKINLMGILEKLEAELKKLPVLTIYIPFEMPDQEAQNLGKWLKENIAPDVIFELRINPDLIGGAAFSYKGVYKDFSLVTKIAEERDKVVGAFKGYLTI